MDALSGSLKGASDLHRPAEAMQKLLLGEMSFPDAAIIIDF